MHHQVMIRIELLLWIRCNWLKKDLCRILIDWKNVEMTGLFKVSSFTNSVRNRPAHVDLMSRGGIHTNNIPCEGGHFLSLQVI